MPLVLFGANYQHPDPLCAKNLRRGHAICRNGRTSENAYPKEQGHLEETKHHATKVQNPGDREGEEGKREQEAKRRREKRKRRKRKKRKERRRKEREK